MPNSNRKLTANPVSRHSGKVLAIAIAVSLVLHLLSYVNISVLTDRLAKRPVPNVQQPVKINIVEKKPQPKDSPARENQQIVEVQQDPTDAPEDAKYKSFQNHKTDKPTKLRELRDNKKAADAAKSAPKKRQIVKSKDPKTEAAPAPQPKMEIGNIGDVEVPAKERRKRYQALMPNPSELTSLIEDGYQQYIDDDIELGDRIDINTTEYRYMGYFTNMRKTISLVWNYPIEAVRKGMQGEVQVEFVIHKDGNISRVKVIRSSGYKMLDDALVEAIKLASPFSPLPEDFGERKLISGSFRYILRSSFAGPPR